MVDPSTPQSEPDDPFANPTFDDVIMRAASARATSGILALTFGNGPIYQVPGDDRKVVRTAGHITHALSDWAKIVGGFAAALPPADELAGYTVDQVAQLGQARNQAVQVLDLLTAATTQFQQVRDLLDAFVTGGDPR